MYKFTWPHITSATKKAVLDQLIKEEISIYDNSGVFAKFETSFANLTRSQHALVVSSGTAGLHSAMVACGFSPEDEVICPAYTFFATVTPIFQTGAIPVLCDAGSDGNIDISKIPQLITSRTKAIIVTHMWGIPCDMDALYALCQRYGLLLIEDCSHAHGAKYKSRPVGSQSDVAVFSLQGQKIVTGGEGGVITTNNQEIYERALLFGHYNKRCKQEISRDSPYYEYATTGFGLKLRAHPFAIAMALEQLTHLSKWHDAKVKNANYLTSKLKHLPQISLPTPLNKDDEPSWYAYTFRIVPGSLAISTEEFCTKLHEYGVTDADIPGSTCPLNYLKIFQDPSLLYLSYRGKVSYKRGDFPVAEAFYESAIKLPIDGRTSKQYTRVLDSYVDAISRIIAEYAV